MEKGRKTSHDGKKNDFNPRRPYESDSIWIHASGSLVKKTGLRYHMYLPESRDFIETPKYLRPHSSQGTSHHRSPGSAIQIADAYYPATSNILYIITSNRSFHAVFNSTIYNPAVAADQGQLVEPQHVFLSSSLGGRGCCNLTTSMQYNYLKRDM